jgi:hypothetical protein
VNGGIRPQVLSRIVLEFGDVSPGMMRLARQAARATV